MTRNGHKHAERTDDGVDKRSDVTTVILVTSFALSRKGPDQSDY